MTNGNERVIDATVLHLRAIKFVTNAGSIRRGTESLFAILERQITFHSRKCDRFAVSLSQFVGSAKITFARFVFRNAKPRGRKPLGMLFNGPGNLFGVAAFGPNREQRELFCFSERVQGR